MRLLSILFLILVAKGALAAEVVSTGRRLDLRRVLRSEGTTVLLFIQETSAMEQEFLTTLEKELPTNDRLALRVVKLKNLENDAARQFTITMTPTAIVFDRWAKEIARASAAEVIRAAVRKGMLMARIAWIDEDHPRAAEVYGRPTAGRPLPGIVKTMSLKPDAFRMFMLMSQLHFSDGFLSRREHEIVGAYVSALNKCKF